MIANLLNNTLLLLLQVSDKMIHSITRYFDVLDATVHFVLLRRIA